MVLFETTIKYWVSPPCIQPIALPRPGDYQYLRFGLLPTMASSLCSRFDRRLCRFGVSFSESSRQCGKIPLFFQAQHLIRLNGKLRALPQMYLQAHPVHTSTLCILASRGWAMLVLDRSHSPCIIFSAQGWILETYLENFHFGFIWAITLEMPSFEHNGLTGLRIQP